MFEIIVSIIEGLVRVVKISRDALADDLEAMSTKIRAGELIPDEAFAQAKKDHDRLDDARDRLPD